jgi:hypothetical protein
MDKMEKIIGWILLVAGIVLMGWTLLSSYNIFTAKAELPEFFEASQEKTLSQEGGTQDIQVQLQQMIGEQLKGMLPVDSIPKLLNLIVWSMLAFILLFGGTQISGLGIKLIKK